VAGRERRLDAAAARRGLAAARALSRGGDGVRPAADARARRDGRSGDGRRLCGAAGEGESFCAGADIEWQRAAIDLSYEENVEDALRLYRMLVAIDAEGAPTVVTEVVTTQPVGFSSGDDV